MVPTGITFFSVIINNIVNYLFVRRTLMAKQTNIRNAENSNTDDSQKVQISEDFNTEDTQNVQNSEDFNKEDIRDSDSDREEFEASIGQRTLEERLTMEVATQGLLYVTAYLLTIVPGMLLSVLDGLSLINESDHGKFYPLLVFNSILLPLQGFFNVFIYVKPSYRRFRDKHPEKPVLFILNRALFDSNIPRLSAMSSIDPSSVKGRKVSRNRNLESSLKPIVEEAADESPSPSR